MSDNTSIEWTDATWNPVWGCTPVSPGCDHCYAETLVNGRLAHLHPGGFGVVRLRPEQLDKPLRWKRPRRIFVNSMSDLFHDDIPDEYIARVFAVMALAHQHTFQVLTKRHGRMRSLLSGDLRAQVAEEMTDLIASGTKLDGAPIVLDRDGDPARGAVRAPGNIWGPEIWPLPNVWLGVSVENQQWANIRIPALLATPAAVRFLSCEPLLGPVSLFANTKIDTGTLVDWVIVGGESGPGARPMHPEWARALRDECDDVGIPFHFKQHGEYRKVEVRNAQPGDVWVLGENGMTVPWRLDTEGAAAHRWGPHRDELMRRVGKKAAGRELDGRTWDEFPQAVTS